LTQCTIYQQLLSCAACCIHRPERSHDYLRHSYLLHPNLPVLSSYFILVLYRPPFICVLNIVLSASVAGCQYRWLLVHRFQKRDSGYREETFMSSEARTRDSKYCSILATCESHMFLLSDTLNFAITPIHCITYWIRGFFFEMGLVLRCSFVFCVGFSFFHYHYDLDNMTIIVAATAFYNDINTRSSIVLILRFAMHDGLIPYRFAVIHIAFIGKSPLFSQKYS
jgi:hypothetical protein